MKQGDNVNMNRETQHFGPGNEPPGGTSHLYRKKTTVRMWPMVEAFTCSNREGRNLEGKPGDFLAEDGYGGYYPIGAEFHSANYERASPEGQEGQ